MSTRALLISGLASPVSLWILGGVVAVTWPGYDPIAESISVMVHAPLGWLQTAGFWIQGVLGVAWAIGAARVMGSGTRERRLVRGLFGLQAGIGFAFAILPTDVGGTRTTLIAELHLANFYLYAVSMPITLFVLARLYGRDPRWQGAVTGTRIAGFLMLVSVALVPLTVAGPLLPYLGLLERAYIAIPSIWQAAVAIRALRAGRGSMAR
ncbi:MAG: DUF998 domain-containing protein [Chloroflexota bacterium]